MKVKMFQTLIVWQKGHQLVLDIYRMTMNYPAEERFCLVSQMRRAAISITANIAEGYRKRGKKDKLRFFNISQGSLAEIYNYIILSRDLKFISEEDYASLEIKIEEVDRLLESYCGKISQEVNRNFLSIFTSLF